jgi:hypothetical protein
MSRLYYLSPIPPFHVADAAALVNTVTETYISPAPQSMLAANQMEAGTRLEYYAFGLASCTTGTNNMTFQLKSGTIGQAIGSAVSICSSGAITLPASSTNKVWRIEGHVHCRTDGATGTVLGIGEVSGWTTGGTDFMQNGTLATATIDTTVAREWRLSGTWSVANAANTLTLKGFGIRLVN